VSQDGSGATILTGANTFGTTAAGGLVVNAGTLRVGSNSAIPGTGLVTVNGGALDLNGFDTLISSLSGTGGTVTDNSTASAGTTTLSVNLATPTDVSTYSGVIANGPTRTVALRKLGLGTLTLDGSAPNTFTGVTSVIDGTLILAKSGVNAITGNVLIGDTVGSDVLQLGAADQIADTSVLTFTAGPSGGSAFLRINGFNETIKGITTTVANAAVIESNGVSGTAMLTVDTAGRVAAISYTGGTTITGGKLVLDNLDAFSSPITNNSLTADALTFNQTIKSLTIGAGVVISGTGGVTKTGPLGLKMTGASTYSGNTVIVGGTLTPANATALPSGGGKGNIVLDGGATAAGTLDLAGSSININGLAGVAGAVPGQVTDSGTVAATLTLGNGDVIASFAGVIKDNAGAGGTLSLTKTGAGVQTLAGASTYAGATNVTGGVLSVSGSIAGSSGVNVSDPTATFEAAGAQRIKSLTVSAGGARVVNAATKIALTVGDGSQATSQLSLTGGKLDLRKNGLAVDYAAGAGNDASALASVRLQILTGYNPASPTAGDGKWDGTTGITSSSIGTLNAIGYALAGDVLPFTNGTSDTFLGTTVDKNTVVARYTLSGDVNLDGAVDFLDLRLAQSYNVTDGTRQWSTGDVNYDGNTDFLDLAKMAQNYNTALPGDVIPGAPAGFEADLARAFASVPEPSLLGLLGICALAVGGRRRKPQ
jgi:fibronectin-binding autotransporter adhesin